MNIHNTLIAILSGAHPTINGKTFLRTTGRPSDVLKGT